MSDSGMDKKVTREEFLKKYLLPFLGGVAAGEAVVKGVGYLASMTPLDNRVEYDNSAFLNDPKFPEVPDLNLETYDKWQVLREQRLSKPLPGMDNKWIGESQINIKDAKSHDWHDPGIFIRSFYERYKDKFKYVPEMPAQMRRLFPDKAINYSDPEFSYLREFAVKNRPELLEQAIHLHGISAGVAFGENVFKEGGYYEGTLGGFWTAYEKLLGAYIEITTYQTAIEDLLLTSKKKYTEEIDKLLSMREKLFYQVESVKYFLKSRITTPYYNVNLGWWPDDKKPMMSGFFCYKFVANVLHIMETFGGRDENKGLLSVNEQQQLVVRDTGKPIGVYSLEEALASESHLFGKYRNMTNKSVPELIKCCQDGYFLVAFRLTGDENDPDSGHSFIIRVVKGPVNNEPYLAIAEHYFDGSGSPYNVIDSVYYSEPKKFLKGILYDDNDKNVKIKLYAVTL